ncbi:MAG TPA: Tat pathway signal protein [Micromonosporaceae bacterium]|nr:Tat pathway signal protein [Micromonosporaceae bacterium]
MAHKRNSNTRLGAVIAQAGLSHAQVARAFVRVALEAGAHEFAGVGRSHVSHWVGGSKPSGRAPSVLCEALSRCLGRPVTLNEVGLATEAAPSLGVPDWNVDTLTVLADLGRANMDVERRHLLGAAAYSMAALALPGEQWWTQMASQGRARSTAAVCRVGRADIAAVRDMTSMFSQIDQRRGGGHARTTVVQYLTADVAGYLRGRFPDDQVRREMFTAASELAYLSGWMAFDNAEHATAQQFFTTAMKLAAEADDPPMAGHVLRAMAHQAVDLGHPRQALDLAAASMQSRRYALATPRERALFGVVHARALAATDQKRAAAAALVHAEDDLAAAKPGDEEPNRVFFFGEASLAHQTACTLRDTGDLAGAERQFRRSVRTRKAATFTRTHAVTLGYLGAVQARQGSIEEACATWSRALDAMDGVRSGRTRQVAVDMRSVLSPFRQRGIRAVAELDARAASYLRE